MHLEIHFVVLPRRSVLVLHRMYAVFVLRGRTLRFCCLFPSTSTPTLDAAGCQVLLLRQFAVSTLLQGGAESRSWCWWCFYCWCCIYMHLLLAGWHAAGRLLACLLLACCLSVGLLLPPAAAGTTTLSIPKIVSEQQCHPVLRWQEAGATVERGKGTRREGRGTRRVQLQRNNTSVRRLAGMKLPMTFSRWNAGRI